MLTEIKLYVQAFQYVKPCLFTIISPSQPLGFRLKQLLEDISRN